MAPSSAPGAATPPFKIKDPALAREGHARVAWARAHMPVLGLIRDEFAREKPLAGLTVAACLHVTKETAVLMETLKAGGAKVVLCGSNPLSTQDDVAAALSEVGIHVYAWRGVNEKEYYQCVDWALDHEPHFTMDDGADLVTRLHTVRTSVLPKVRAGTEETTTGVTRFKSMAKEGALKYPIVAVNDAQTKHFFDNRYGTGQSTIDGIMRATSVLVAGKVFVVAGFGWVGKGVAMRARGLGARVVVTEVSPVRALEAAMEGYEVLPAAEAAAIADFFVTVTGNKGVVAKDVIARLKSGVFLANSGHFDNEIDLVALKAQAKSVTTVRPNVEAYELEDGRVVHVLGAGRLVNLAAAEGHPPEVMDMSFANQALAARWLAENAKRLTVDVHTMPRELDDRVAALKLKAMGISIDALTEAQVRYMTGWREGT